MSTSTNFMENKFVLNFEDPSIYHDRVLVVGEKKFFVVAGTLSVWSEFFRTMFDGNFSEGGRKEIELKELNPEVFSTFLKLIYQNNSVPKADVLVPLIELSYRFLTPMVLEICKEFIDKNFDKLDEIKLQLLEAACIHGFKELKNSTVMYMKNHISCESCSEYLDLCEKFNLPELKEKMQVAVSKWGSYIIPLNLIIDLAKSAFKHDLQILKEKIRLNIYCLAKELTKRCCVRNENNEKVDSVFSINWFLKNNSDAIFALPAEVSQFIIMSTCRKSL